MPSTNSEDDFDEIVALADTPMGLGTVVKAEVGGGGDVQFRFLHSAVEYSEPADARFHTYAMTLKPPAFGCGLDAVVIREPSALAKRIEAARYRVALPRTSTASTPSAQT